LRIVVVVHCSARAASVLVVRGRFRIAGVGLGAIRLPRVRLIGLVAAIGRVQPGALFRGRLDGRIGIVRQLLDARAMPRACA
jgi:hypothetical protein